LSKHPRRSRSAAADNAANEERFARGFFGVASAQNDDRFPIIVRIGGAAIPATPPVA
jgi:hypothetical protein